MHELVAGTEDLLRFLEEADIDSLVTSPEQRTRVTLMAAVHWIEVTQSGEISAEGAGAGAAVALELKDLRTAHAERSNEPPPSLKIAMRPVLRELRVEAVLAPQRLREWAAEKKAEAAEQQQQLEALGLRALEAADAKEKAGKAAHNRRKRERQAAKRTAAKDRKEAMAEAAKRPPFDGAEAEGGARPRPWFSRGHTIAASALVALCLVAGGGAYGLGTAGLAALGGSAFDSFKPGAPVGEAVMPARPRLVSCLTSP
jgi:hypothetical protein